MVCDCSPHQVRGAREAHSAAALRCMQVLTTTPLSSPHRHAALRMLIRLQARFRSRRLRREQRAQQEALAAKLTQRRAAVLIQRRWRDELERRVLQTNAVRCREPRTLGTALRTLGTALRTLCTARYARAQHGAPVHPPFSPQVRSILARSTDFLTSWRERCSSELASGMVDVGARAQQRWNTIKGLNITVALTVCSMFRQRVRAADCIRGANKRMLAERHRAYFLAVFSIQRILRRGIKAYNARKSEREAARTLSTGSTGLPLMKPSSMKPPSDEAL